MKNKLLVMAFCGHLLAIAAWSLYGISQQNNGATNNPITGILDTYTAYTALQSDYSFFSPDISPAPRLDIAVYTEDGSSQIPFDVAIGEIGIRRFTSLNAFNQIPEAREFMTRSWAAYTLKHNPDASALSISYFVQVPLSINQFQSNKPFVDSLMFHVKYNVDEQ